MRPTPTLAHALVMVAAAAIVGLSGCSSSTPRDINYGTDVGLGYVPPDGGGSQGLETGYDSASKDVGSAIDGASAVDLGNGDLADGGDVSTDLVDAAGDTAAGDASISQGD